jgi:WD40 repeat protein
MTVRQRSISPCSRLAALVLLLLPIIATGAESSFPPGFVMRFGSMRLRHGQAISGLAFSKDGKTLASSSWDRTISLWELPSGTELHRFQGHAGYVNCVALSPDGKLLASGGENFRLWDIATGKVLHQAAVPRGEVFGVAFSPDGKLVAYGGTNPGAGPALNIIEAGTGNAVAQIVAPSNVVRAVAFSPDGKTLASVGFDNAVRLWDTANGNAKAQLDGHTGGTLAVTFSTDGKTLASGSSDGTVRLWDTGTHKEIKRFTAERARGGGVTGVSLSSDGKLVAACTSLNRVTRVFDIASDKEVHTFPGGWFRCVAFAPDGKTLAAGDGNNVIRLWELPSGKVLNPTEPHDSGVHCIAVAPDGKTLAAGTFLKTVQLWDLKTGKPQRALLGHEHGIYPVAWSPDGRHIASGSRDGTARVWDAVSGKELRKFLAYDGDKSGDVWVYGLSFAPDGKRLAGACRDGLVRIWDIDSGKELARCEGHNAFVWGVVFAPDGKTLVSCGNDGSIRQWDAGSGAELRRLGDALAYESVAVSPDGRVVAAGTRGAVYLIDAQNGQALRALKEHPDSSFRNRLYRDGRTLAFSPDGRTVASGSWQVLQLWEVATGQERLSFVAHRGEVMSVAFLSDGRRLVTGSPDTTAILWDLPTCVLGKPAAKVTSVELESRWAELIGDDARKAYRAQWTLAASPKDVMPLLQKQLKPAAATDGDRVTRLLKELDSDDFETREKATEELEKVGNGAEPALRKVLAGNVSVEMKQRIELLLGKLRMATASPDRLREARALELLEQLGTPQAVELLKELSKGAAGARLTEEATAAVKRAARR